MRRILDEIARIQKTSEPISLAGVSRDRNGLVIASERFEDPGFDVVPVVPERRFAICADARIQHRICGGRGLLLSDVRPALSNRMHHLPRAVTLEQRRTRGRIDFIRQRMRRRQWRPGNAAWLREHDLAPLTIDDMRELFLLVGALDGVAMRLIEPGGKSFDDVVRLVRHNRILDVSKRRGNAFFYSNGVRGVRVLLP